LFQDINPIPAKLGFQISIILTCADANSGS